MIIDRFENFRNTLVCSQDFARSKNDNSGLNINSKNLEKKMEYENNQEETTAELVNEKSKYIDLLKPDFISIPVAGCMSSCGGGTCDPGGGGWF